MLKGLFRKENQNVKEVKMVRKITLMSLFMAALLFTFGQANADIVTADLDSGLTPTDMVNTLLGGGITVSNITYTGANSAAGTFTGGTGIIGFESGIILSSGNIANVIGPNVSDNITANNSQPGDSDLDGLIPGYSTNDASVLEFDFVPSNNVVSFLYVFGSDEYNEWVDSAYNDVFGFFIDGVNVALIPGTATPVAINNVNEGDPWLPGTGDNEEYYICNDTSDCGATLNTEMDGLTTVLWIESAVNAGQEYHMKLAIADAGDYIYDSWVLLEAGSFVPEPPDTDIPEPATLLLLGSGLTGLAFARRMKKER